MEVRPTRRSLLKFSMTAGLTFVTENLRQKIALATERASNSDHSPTGPSTDSRHLIIAVEESDSTVGFYDSSDGTEVARIHVGFWPHEIDVSHDGKTAYVSNFGVKDYDEKIGRPGWSVSVIDIQNMCEVDRLFSFGNEIDCKTHMAPHGVKLSPDQRSLYVNVEVGNKLLIFNLTERGRWHLTETLSLPISNDEVLQDKASEIDVPTKTHSFAFSPDGKYLWIVAGPQGIHRLDVKRRKITGTISEPLPQAARGVAYTNDGKQLIGSFSNRILLINPETLEVEKRFENLGVRQILYSISTANDAYILAPAVWESQVIVIEKESGRVEKRILVGIDPIHVTLSPSGNAAYVSHGRTQYISEISLSSFSESRRILTHGGPNGIAIAPFSTFKKRSSLRLGACLPLSGPSSEEGRDLRLGYQYWEELVNSSGGILLDGDPHLVEISYLDTESKIDETSISLLTEELIDHHKSEFLLGTYPSPPNEHSGRVADKRKVPLVTASGAAERIYQQGFQYVFGIMSIARNFLEGTIKLVTQLNPKPKTLCFLSCDDPAALQDAKTTADIAIKEGLEIVFPQIAGIRIEKPGVIVFPHLTEKFDEYIAAILQLRPDLFLNTGHKPEAVAIVRSAKDKQFSPMGLAFSVGPAFPSFVDDLQELSENMLGTAMWVDSQPNCGHDKFVLPKEFSRLFFDRFSKKPSYLSAGATACGFVYEEAFKSAKTKNTLQVRDALSRINHDSFYSHIEFDERGVNASRPLVTIQLQRIAGQIIQTPLWPRELSDNQKPVWPFPGWSKKP